MSVSEVFAFAVIQAELNIASFSYTKFLLGYGSTFTYAIIHTL